MSASSWVHLDVAVVLRETDKAFLLRLDDGEEVWIPRSQVADADTVAEGDCHCTVSVTEWFAEKEGLV